MKLWRLERRRAWRSSRARIVAVAMFVVSVVSVALGVQLARQHEAAGARDVETFASRLRIDAPQKSAFAIAAYSDVLVARGVRDAALLTAGDLAALPDAAVLRLGDPPQPVPTLAERSPSALLLGTLDFVWVLALLLPLAAIALAYDAVSRDRERGTLAMLLGPARSAAPLLFARAAATTEVLLVGVLPGLVASVMVSPWAVPVVVAYVWLVAAAVVTTSAASERTATALAVALGAWLMFGVAIPLSGSALARSSYPDPDPRARLAGEQGAEDLFTRPSEGVVAAEVTKDPSLDPEQAQDGAFSQMRYDFLLMRERLRRKRGARSAEERVLHRRAELLEIASWMSPTSIVANALAGLAGTRPSERTSFTKDAEVYRTEVAALVRADILERRAALGEAGRFPSSNRLPTKSADAAQIASVLFAAAGIGLLLFGARRIARGGLAPTKEDA